MGGTGNDVLCGWLPMASWRKRALQRPHATSTARRPPTSRKRFATLMPVTTDEKTAFSTCVTHFLNLGDTPQWGRSGAGMGQNATRGHDNTPVYWSYPLVFILVPEVRLELTRCCHRRILSPLRLPIPPSRLGAFLPRPRRIRCQQRPGALASMRSPEAGRRPAALNRRLGARRPRVSCVTS